MLRVCGATVVYNMYFVCIYVYCASQLLLKKSNVAAMSCSMEKMSVKREGGEATGRADEDSDSDTAAWLEKVMRWVDLVDGSLRSVR